MFIQGEAKYTCLHKSAFVIRRIESTAEPQSLMLILLHFLSLT